MMQQLYTEEGRSIPELPWNRYPRPQTVRPEWLCLNGIWELKTEKSPAEQIRVPFCPESLLSGIQRTPDVGERLRYRRFFTVPGSWKGKRVLLHCGAVSRSAEVHVNGRRLACHDNSYLPFSADITEALRDGENELVIYAVNDLSHRHPWGKQSAKRGGMWYTPVSGIWQTVWLEPVPEHFISALKITTAGERVKILAEGAEEGSIFFNGKEYPLRNGAAEFSVPDAIFWSPEHPYLYSFTVMAGEDTVDSYFALRTLSTEICDGVPRLCLNGKPYFFNGLLDQGYWSDGLYTPAVPEAYEKDILTVKALGFNTLRKHIKIEPEQFYYDCDRFGMIVLQDMVNCGDYSWLRDTALPTIHINKADDRFLHRDPEMRANFRQAMRKTVSLLGNHPCICLWTIFNEGWGQFCADEAYDELKETDPSRFTDSTSGWFHQKKSDVDSIHNYFEKQHLGKQKLPQLISEFGGFSYKIDAHSFNLKKTYGYRKYSDREQYVSALQALYRDEILPLARKGLCGAIYTQVSDVEDETNGLLTFDRRAVKVRPEELRPILKELCPG